MKFATGFLAIALAFGSAAPSFAADLTFTLVNKTNSVLTYFYASPVGVSDWEDDVFGDQVLGAGESIKITIADGRRACEYDLKMKFDDDTETDDVQNLCEMSTYTISE